MSKNLAPKNNVFYRNQNWKYPKIARGEGIYLFGEDGKKYFDACSGSAVANIGHGNKEIAEYTKEMMSRIAFTHLSRWTVDSIEDCAAKIADWCAPLGDLNHVYFVSGGSEATETALKMARQYYYERDGHNTSKWKIISKWNSFHGNTMGSLSMTGIPERRKIYDPMLIQFPKINQFYHYRNPWNAATLKETSILAAEELEREILRQGQENIAAFITEPVVGAAAPGVHPDKIYFKMVREICDKYDVLLIVDEVMAGAGRTGKRMASEWFGAKPDIITVAKGLSSGYTPIGAAIATDEIFDTIMVNGSGSFAHGHTYAGNPLSCGIAKKVMDIIERENYIENGLRQGEILGKKLQDMSKYPIVGDVRGKGLMYGIEFVKNKDGKEPFADVDDFRNKLVDECLKEGYIPYPGGGTADGVRGDHMLIAPPISITLEELKDMVGRLDVALSRLSEMFS